MDEARALAIVRDELDGAIDPAEQSDELGEALDTLDQAIAVLHKGERWTDNA